MAHPPDEAAPPAPSQRPRRERSTRYPGATLAESLKLCASIDELGLDNLAAPAIASALGYTNIRTNTFSAPLSAARQFGLLSLAGDRYALTPLAREILHPASASDLPRLNRKALLEPPLYAELAERLGGKRVPDVEILANILHHHHQIITSAKRSAAEAFLESAQFAGVIGDDRIFHPNGLPAPAAASRSSGDRLRTPGPRPNDVRLDLRLWDRDEGKIIRVRAPQAISAASYERFLQAFRLLVRIED